MNKIIRNLNLDLLLFIILIFKSSFAQDTLVFKDGQIKFGRVVGVDTKLNILELSTKEGHSIVSLGILNNFSTNALDENWKGNSRFTFSSTNTNRINRMSNNKKYLKFTPSVYSIGLNFSSLFDPSLVNDFDNFGRTYSTNPYIETFFQMEFNEGVAFRFPVRIGINPLKKTVVNPSNSFYGMFSRELICDFGFEPICYFNKNYYKLKWFAAPSISLVAGKSVSRTLSNGTNGTTYTPINLEFGYRLGALVGYQYWFCPKLQFEGSFGYFITNNYWVPNDGGLPNKKTYFGRNLRAALIYRL